MTMQSTTVERSLVCSLDERIFENVPLSSLDSSIYEEHYRLISQCDIDEMMDLQLEMDSFVYLGIQKQVLNYNYIIEFSKALSKYGSILAFYPFFKDVGDHMKTLGQIIAQRFEIILDQREFISIMFETFVSTLYSLLVHAFKHISVIPTFYNDSIISDIKTILARFNEDNDSYSFEKIEFFGF